MSDSGRPRLRDMRALYNLLEECADLGSDSVAWRNRLLEGASAIIGARVGLYMHVHHALREDEDVKEAMAWGFMDADHLALWGLYQQEQAQRDDPFHTGYFRDHAVRLRTRSLTGVVNRREWEKSRHYNDFIRPCGLDDRITSSLRVGGGADDTLQTLVFHRDAGDGAFAPGAKYLVHLLHHEIAQRLGGKLVWPKSRLDTSALPPRILQVLEGLLAGKSEKRIAKDLGLSPHTVNRHVQRLYRHFDVNSRAQLVALLAG
ncbi:MAG: hypothetical protein KDE22_07280 [Rhodobacterales bacterium]|nr:hypothetical protein [Rhodobacterales bacterium]